MRRRKDSLKDYKINLILIGIVLVLMSVNLIMLIKYFSSDDENEQLVENTVIAQEDNSTVLDEVTDDEGKEMSEQDRMRRYAIQFIDNLDNEEFSEAYEKLNTDFKQTYFPTQNEFEQYVKERIGTGELTINFNNIERLGNEKTGNIYVLWVDVYDVLGNDYVSEKETDEEDEYGNMNIVILERDYNDYELSFSLN